MQPYIVTDVWHLVGIEITTNVNSVGEDASSICRVPSRHGRSQHPVLCSFSKTLSVEFQNGTDFCLFLNESKLTNEHAVGSMRCWEE